MELLERYRFVEISGGKESTTPIYRIIEPNLGKGEKEAMSKCKSKLGNKYLSSLKEEPEVAERWGILKEKIASMVRGVSKQHRDFVVSRIAGEVMGYGKLGLFVDDDNLEEIMVNGVKAPVYVYHRKYGMCKTEVEFDSLRELNDTISSICRANGRGVETIMDISAIDGNRINITKEPLPSRGPAITIRKQRRRLFSIIELIEEGTISAELTAFLWMAVEGMNLTPANIIIAGSVGSGKTTTLNALCTFIPPRERVITIEDTLELELDNIENKIQLEARGEYGIDSLLRDTLRMRPDRIMVGEIRGREAITLFNAMSIGRIGMGTLHASSAKEATTRLESQPMGVPPSVISSLDLVVVQNKFVHGGKIVRRITEVAEITGAIKDTIMMGKIYEWDPKSDRVVRTREQGLETPILFLDKLSDATKYEKRIIMGEMELRRRVLEYMVKRGIKKQEEVREFIKRFYLDPERLMRENPGILKGKDESSG